MIRLGFGFDFFCLLLTPLLLRSRVGSLLFFSFSLRSGFLLLFFSLCLCLSLTLLPLIFGFSCGFSLLPFAFPFGCGFFLLPFTLSFGGCILIASFLSSFSLGVSFPPIFFGSLRRFSVLLLSLGLTFFNLFFYALLFSLLPRCLVRSSFVVILTSLGLLGLSLAFRLTRFRFL